MTAFVDGIQSLCAALLTVFVGLVPAWFAHVAIDGGLAPSWGYAPLALLVVVTGMMGFSFLRKAGAGIGPLRERRRS